MKSLFVKIRPYFAIMRLNQQAVVLSALLFGFLDANFSHINTILLTAVALYLISVASFIINEFIDARDTDKYSSQIRSLAHASIIPSFALFLWLGINLLGLIILFSLKLYWQGVLSVTLGTLYSLPPIRLKARFLWDQLTVLTYLVITPYSLGFSLNNLPFDKMIAIPFLSLLFFLAIGQGFHLISDLAADKTAGLTNTPVVLGYMVLVKILVVCAFLSTMGFIYLVYKHTNPWYYPLIFFSTLSLLALGYMRGIIYNEEKLIARSSWAIKTGISLGNWFVIYQVLLLYLHPLL